MSQHLYLLDSSILVVAERKNPPQALLDRISPLIRARTAAVNEIVTLEVLVGYRTQEQLSTARSRLRTLIQLPITVATWDQAADLGFALRRSGVVVNLPDLIIAASAIEHDAVLLHADSDFDLIAQNSQLRVESYAGAAT
ncbi:MAG: PIN domain-containing protein [Dehalococcoidia bacterium]|nr:PIN domain-containing protein [Dehalococcoidia bacterium]